MKTKTLKLVALTTAVLGTLMLAEAKPEGKGDGARKGGKQCQKHESRNGDSTRRENRKERFDKNEDGKLGPHERKAMQRAKKRHQQQDDTEA